MMMKIFSIDIVHSLFVIWAMKTIFLLYLTIFGAVIFSKTNKKTSVSFVKHKCDEKPCQNSGTCLPQIFKNLPVNDSLKTYHCICTSEFEGENCEFQKNLTESSRYSDIIGDLVEISNGSFKFQDEFLFGGKPRNWIFNNSFTIYDTKAFNFKEMDLMAVLHIQKTGGTTLGRHLTVFHCSSSIQISH